MREYIELDIGDFGPSYIRRDSLSDLKDIEAIIFDCDGVLIDVGDSYARAVNETASNLSNAYMGIDIPSEVIDSEVIYRFKRTGGFNNDWALSYAIQMYIFSLLSKDELEDMISKIGMILSISDEDERFNKLLATENKYDLKTEKIRSGLISFAEELDHSGAESVDEKLMNKIGLELKNSLGYPGEVGSGMIPTLFEYIFEGKELFFENFGFKPRFNIPIVGLLDKGSLIIVKETLEEFSSMLGGFKFGIASGSLERTAKHVLGGFSDYFIEEAEVWMDDVNRVMKKTGKEGLRKPDPFSLIEAGDALEPFRRGLYVGDSMADLKMTENACATDDRYHFAGVYQYVYPSDKIMEDFIEMGSDIVTPSVNELPEIFDWIRSV